MASNFKKDKGKGTTVPSMERATRYAQLRAECPTLPKAKAAKMAGYAGGSNTRHIEQSATYRSLEDRIKAAQASSGFNAASCLDRLQQVIERDGAKYDRNAIAAVKVGSEITGERMPTEVRVGASADAELLAAVFGGAGRPSVLVTEGDRAEAQP